jgi:hypothetical protein
MPQARFRLSERPDADLHEWLLVTGLRTFDPARIEMRLVGRIFNDRRQRYPDGKWVMTSAVQSPRHLIIAGSTIRTQNTLYRLHGRGAEEDITLD